jgi:DnaJ-class molecular chaperone
MNNTETRHYAEEATVSQSITRSATAVDCPACKRMGRVTVIRQDGRLTTETCGHCNGYGFMEPCSDPNCHYCTALSARMQPLRTLF